ncbi:U2 snRNP-associated SURP motif-containing protein [Galendromus occidentalis]|uniref:U2 snRNP-associated SURP motif-containing protein n=1 Tax=Galendromus occidentalis TaxID=34638 RepID=A0AAJ7WHS6_9ACAR|nr:U2 snRNP-associated SURP motif-containing protein [Galendromus occidentalis]
MSGGKFQVKAFSLGLSSNRRTQQQKAEKQRQEEDSKAAAQAYEEFVATFENDKAKPKTFVKAGIVAPGTGEREVSKQLYKPPRMDEIEQKSRTPPSSRHSSESSSHSSRSHGDQKPAKPGRKKNEPKKKSVLELYKEELKIIQEEREERHRLKGVIKGQLVDEPKLERHHHHHHSSYDSDDPNTTNIYMSNLDSSLTEKDLCELFGAYGPLASIKIMWPRTDEDRKKNRNYGFVAYMSRKDGERAMSLLQGKPVRGLDMRMSWSKPIVIPPTPIYIPPCMQHLTMPPAPSGLPFNCQPPLDRQISLEKAQALLEEDGEELRELVSVSTVRVVPPNDRTLLSLIHRMVEFVVREGPMFEALVMSKEFSNPMFRFLFNFQCPAHVYYRWRLFSVLQGDNPSKYRLKKFKIFKEGSWWKPPTPNPWIKGMPEHMFKKMEAELRRKESKTDGDPATGRLDSRQRAKVEYMVRNLTPEKKRIGETMMYCIEHAFAAEEIVDLLVDSLDIIETPLYKKIARFYLVSDILYNCTARLPNASFFRVAFEPFVTKIVKALTTTYDTICDKETATQFKQRVLNVLKAWQEWSLYSKDVLLQLQNIFMGFDKKSLVDIDDVDDDDTSSEKDEKEKTSGIKALVGYGSDDSEHETKEDDTKPKFVTSKWETVDPKVVEEQAVTTSKWDIFEEDKDQSKPRNRFPGEDQDLQETQSQLDERLDSERRMKLREIECEVLKLQDDLERKRLSRSEIQDQCREFRERLVRRMEDDERRRRDEYSSGRSKRRYDDDDRKRDSFRKDTKRSRRSPSPRRRSPSPVYRKRNDRRY